LALLPERYPRRISHGDLRAGAILGEGKSHQALGGPASEHSITKNCDPCTGIVDAR
jgi:hypothetical protein